MLGKETGRELPTPPLGHPSTSLCLSFLTVNGLLERQPEPMGMETEGSKPIPGQWSHIWPPGTCTLGPAACSHLSHPLHLWKVLV